MNYQTLSIRYRSSFRVFDISKRSWNTRISSVSARTISKRWNLPLKPSCVPFHMIDRSTSPEAHEPSYRGTEGCGPAICNHVRGRRKGVSYCPFNWSFNRQIITLSNIKVQEHETFASDRPCMLNRLVASEKSAPPALCKDRFQQRSARFMKVSLIGLGI